MKQQNFLLKKFKEKGYRITLPREVILDVLKSSPSHLDAEELYLRVNKRFSGIGIATIYRSLNLLTKMGIIKKYDFGEKKARYELINEKDKKHHHHLICSKCGKVIDYDDFFEEETKLFNYMASLLSKKHRFKINSHEANFYGLCRKCQKEIKK